ncbi:MAG TPA: hypothetical protein VFS95_10560 [Telluria sp.]|jgi:hypothetical protein|nr:hypothetical protein [Telluria sp.]
MTPFLARLRRKDLIAAASVSTVATIVFLVAGLFWHGAIFVLVSLVAWVRVLAFKEESERDGMH